MPKLMLTGSTGFLGARLFESLNDIFDIVTVSRSGASNNSNYCVGSFDNSTDFSKALDNVDIVVHTAGVAHNKKGSESLDAFRSCNTYGTLNLARQAAKKGVSRFVFISTIGVNGLSNSAPFRFDDIENPEEDYAISKYEAEVGLKKISQETSMEVVIIRPPLIYGKDAPGNFGSLLKLTQRNFPLPIASIKNVRSFVSIDNLVDMISVCLEHPAAANQVFLVSDGENLSTPEFINKLMLAAGKRPLLINVPYFFLKAAATMLGRGAALKRFSSSLVVDIHHTKKTLGWKPLLSVDKGLKNCFTTKVE